MHFPQLMHLQGWSVLVPSNVSLFKSPRWTYARGTLLRHLLPHPHTSRSRPVDSSVDNASGFRVLRVQSIAPKALADGHRLGWAFSPLINFYFSLLLGAPLETSHRLALQFITHQRTHHHRLAGAPSRHYAPGHWPPRLKGSVLEDNVRKGRTRVTLEYSCSAYSKPQAAVEADQTVHV